MCLAVGALPLMSASSASAQTTALRFEGGVSELAGDVKAQGSQVHVGLTLPVLSYQLNTRRGLMVRDLFQGATLNDYVRSAQLDEAIFEAGGVSLRALQQHELALRLEHERLKMRLIYRVFRPQRSGEPLRSHAWLDHSHLEGALSLQLTSYASAHVSYRAVRWGRQWFQGFFNGPLGPKDTEQLPVELPALLGALEALNRRELIGRLSLNAHTQALFAGLKANIGYVLREFIEQPLFSVMTSSELGVELTPSLEGSSDEPETRRDTFFFTELSYQRSLWRSELSGRPFELLGGARLTFERSRSNQASVWAGEVAQGGYDSSRWRAEPRLMVRWGAWRYHASYLYSQQRRERGALLSPLESLTAEGMGADEMGIGASITSVAQLTSMSLQRALSPETFLAVVYQHNSLSSDRALISDLQRYEASSHEVGLRLSVTLK